MILMTTGTKKGILVIHAVNFVCDIDDDKGVLGYYYDISWHLRKKFAMSLTGPAKEFLSCCLHQLDHLASDEL